MSYNKKYLDFLVLNIKKKGVRYSLTFYTFEIFIVLNYSISIVITIVKCLL